MKAGIREVKSRFSKYLRRVKQGEILEQGIGSWRGGKPQGMAAPAPVRGETSIASLVAENRR